MDTIKTIDTFIYHIALAIYKKSKEEECNANEVINSEYICKLAAETLGLRYERKGTFSGMPKGCYWDSSFVYYNDATKVVISPKYRGDRGGICFILGIHFILRLAQSCNQYNGADRDIFIINV